MGCLGFVGGGSFLAAVKSGREVRRVCERRSGCPVRRGKMVRLRAASVDEEEELGLVREELRAELMAIGIELDQLMNPEKVVKMEKKVRRKRDELERMRKDEVGQTGEDGEGVLAKAEAELIQLEKDLNSEKRFVMQQWLKRLFWYQGLFCVAVGGFLSWGQVPGFQGELPLVSRALGFWLVWMFTIPSLRARKPVKAEKQALNVAFLMIPVLNLLLPTVTKDTFIIWVINVLVLLGCYGYYGWKEDTEASASGIQIRGVLRFLDWGSWR
mmetsp:Transcript_8921/g.17970  ORF Transcript_8921/g.17970 Transcript_8921/m.17970 type:complete len:270 (-) Transcript_8921:1314-2123(-)|eukprot:CAMPEP_0184685472 /NCGR_PEP_ID=MMETSP0312-20130426/19131_1 /TAXON_ID=31354 /ORGANISM="Compsopogon coeruleus, Strain SAG 36.94" /LENGTH=269 /DNA_ID=CAMNT_0027139617 /DNA_START=66 /DNA_END=875 /DNA_ORIENTATION=+